MNSNNICYSFIYISIDFTQLVTNSNGFAFKLLPVSKYNTSNAPQVQYTKSISHQIPKDEMYTCKVK